VAELFLKFFYTSSVKKINKEFVMLVTRYNPNIRMRDFRRGFDLLNSMLDEFNIDNNTELKNDFSPAINTREGEYAYHIEVDLPGMKKDDINIQVEDNTLVISGERKMKEEMKEENYYKIESSFGSFSRSFSLPEEADIENIHAESTDGVLEVVVPKLQSAKVDKVKKISIN
jgi:HSP20 family protein